MSSNFESSEKVMNDIVHGIIKLPSYITEIIDTPHFQRLRSIAQLGVSNYVYPSSSYSRFEHCIGTFHLASQLMNKLKFETESEQLILPNEVKCVEIAALCHDLGHGPYSHFWDSMGENKTDINHRSHEELSGDIFRDLINTTKINKTETLKDIINLSDEMVDLIANIILGKDDKNSKKKFLFQIVANKDSGLDVDKFDYLCRDMIYLGWSNKNKIHDIKRIMNFFKLIKDDNGDWHLAMRDREIFHIYDIFYSRHLLYRYGYKHKTVIAVECMFRNALTIIMGQHLNELIENVLKDEFDNSKRYEKTFLFSQEFISKCCDFDIWNAMNKYTPNIVRDINERNLCKLYCKLMIKQSNNVDKSEIEPSNNEKKHEIKPSQIFNLEKEINKKFQTEMKEERKFININLSKFSLKSEKKKDPILLIPFYAKSNPNKYFKFDTTKKAQPAIVKYKSDEHILMIFTESPDYELEKNINTRDEKEIEVIEAKEKTRKVKENEILEAIKKQFIGESNSLYPCNEISKLLEKYSFSELKY